MKKSLLSLSLIAALVAVSAVAQEKIQGGISGKVLLGPQHPVSRPGEKNYKPYQTTLVVKTEDGSRVITQFTSKENGRFRVSLEPGTYSVGPIPSSSQYPRCETVTVKVEPNKFTRIKINCDTGIR